ncbi:ferredoxin reductase family protein [Kaistia sp. MMO-174]|uniref:ferredoxin reductase family protein n=1 Tax=Kaistia sp. MMO-174 TaxID=3081256 RepID=UPI00301915D3
MRNIKIAFWLIALVPAALYLLIDPSLWQPAGFIPFRASMMQLTGVVAIVFMSVAMLLALRPRALEGWFGGLDKMYRLHKWLGIGALVLSILHWMWSQAPGWAISLGLFERGQRPPRTVIEEPVRAFFASQRGFAEGIGEWAFYAAVILLVLALVRYFPYRWFYKTHRLIAIAYLVLALHAVVLFSFDNWATPLGWLVALLLAGGTVAAVLALADRVGASRRVIGRLAELRFYPGVRTVETRIEVGQGWPGHKAGQFAFAMSDPAEGPHPYTIASAWNDTTRHVTLIAKQLGDHTGRLREKLAIGQPIRLEGPYGCFTFDDACPHQIWIAGGIGITPFIGRMEQLAREAAGTDPSRRQTVDLFHSTSDVDEDALAKLAADASAANIRLHLMIDSRDGFLTGERIRAAVPNWREASLWFCGPAGFGDALRRDFAAQGFPVGPRFHQELFSMR